MPLQVSVEVSVPIGYPVTTFNAVVQPTIPHNSQTPSPDDHFVEAMPSYQFGIEGPPGFHLALMPSAPSGVYSSSSGNPDLSPFGRPWSPSDPSSLMEERHAGYFPHQISAQVSFAESTSSCTSTLDAVMIDGQDSPWEDTFCLSGKRPEAGSVVNQLGGMSGALVMPSAPPTYHVPTDGMLHGG